MKCKECDRDMVCVHSFNSILDEEGSVVIHEYNCVNNHIGKRIEFVDKNKDDVLTNIKREEDRLCEGCGENESASGVDFCGDCILEAVKKADKEFYEKYNKENEGDKE